MIVFDILSLALKNGIDTDAGQTITETSGNLKQLRLLARLLAASHYRCVSSKMTDLFGKRWTWTVSHLQTNWKTLLD
jgi:hypothetical protein